MSSDLRSSGGSNVVIDRLHVGLHRPTLEDAPPPQGRVQRSLPIMQRRINVAEEVPNYTTPVSTVGHLNKDGPDGEFSCKDFMETKHAQ